MVAVLPQFSSFHILCFFVQCVRHGSVFDLHCDVQSDPSVKYTLSQVHTPLFTTHHTLNTVYFKLHPNCNQQTAHYILLTSNCSLHSAHCIVHTAQCLCNHCTTRGVPPAQASVLWAPHLTH